MKNVAIPLDEKVARWAKVWKDVADLLAWNSIANTAPVLHTAHAVQRQCRFSWRDRLRVAAVQRSECNDLPTEDLEDAQDIHGVQVLNPLARSLPGFVV